MTNVRESASRSELPRLSRVNRAHVSGHYQGAGAHAFETSQWPAYTDEAYTDTTRSTRQVLRALLPPFSVTALPNKLLDGLAVWTGMDRCCDAHGTADRCPSQRAILPLIPASRRSTILMSGGQTEQHGDTTPSFFNARRRTHFILSQRSLYSSLRPAGKPVHCPHTTRRTDHGRDPHLPSHETTPKPDARPTAEAPFPKPLALRAYGQIDTPPGQAS
ncbi:hypothetical protein BD311DRAFT_99099 [Dichomitus squalens]|uniref:Uncharacterized protein n=1 Tax=Dichomitus squalens TaxID=114155 RepID=A0A4Q9MUI6_9APHY|nr:hypothetical protein BD311DRAFT_99099 [Dichomitus squalens]